jgi:hypothetical protein
MGWFDSPEEQKAERLQELHNLGEQREAEGIEDGWMDTLSKTLRLSNEEREAYESGRENVRNQRD